MLCWKQEELPHEYKDAAITHLYKNKGNWQVCNISKGILSVPKILWPHQDCTMDFKYHSPKGILSININRKTILARILLKKLQTHLEGTSQDLPPEKNTSPLWTQCGFRQDRGTVSGNSTRSVASRIKVSRSH